MELLFLSAVLEETQISVNHSDPSQILVAFQQMAVEQSLEESQELELMIEAEIPLEENVEVSRLELTELLVLFLVVPRTTEREPALVVMDHLIQEDLVPV